MINLIGLILIVIAVRIFVFAVKMQDTSDNLSRIQGIGGSILMAIMGGALLFSSKSFCEVFRYLCK